MIELQKLIFYGLKLHNSTNQFHNMSSSSDTKKPKLSKEERKRIYNARHELKVAQEAAKAAKAAKEAPTQEQLAAKAEKDDLISKNTAARRAVYEEYYRIAGEMYPNDYNCDHSGRHNRDPEFEHFRCMACGRSTNHMWVHTSPYSAIYDKYAVEEPHSIKRNALDDLYDQSKKLQDEMRDLAR